MYIKASVNLKIFRNNVIDVTYNVPFDTKIFGSIPSEITPVMRLDDRIDEQALADYDSFVTNIYAMLSALFDVVDIEQSNKSETSWYFYLYAKNKNDGISTKFLIRLRLSDHEYSKRHNARKEREFVERKAQEYKRPKEKLYQEWKIKQIIVNNKKYFSYDDAEDAIYDELEEYSKKIFNKGI